MKNEKSSGTKKTESIDDETLEQLLKEQMQNQIRSDYRRSLGKEHQRRYME